MSGSPDELAFEKGMTALAEGRHEEAVAFFESAVRLGAQRATGQRRMRYLSFFGLSSSLADRATPQAIRACETAAKKEFLNPEMHLNLGRVLLLAGKTTRALQALERGLLLSPRNKALKAALRNADRRGRPPIPWLGRGHPINRMLGKMRRQLRSETPAGKPA